MGPKGLIVTVCLIVLWPRRSRRRRMSGLYRHGYCWQSCKGQSNWRTIFIFYTGHMIVNQEQEQIRTLNVFTYLTSDQHKHHATVSCWSPMS